LRCDRPRSLLRHSSGLCWYKSGGLHGPSTLREPVHETASSTPFGARLGIRSSVFLPSFIQSDSWQSSFCSITLASPMPSFFDFSSENVPRYLHDADAIPPYVASSAWHFLPPPPQFFPIGGLLPSSTDLPPSLSYLRVLLSREVGAVLYFFSVFFFLSILLM